MRRKNFFVAYALAVLMAVSMLPATALTEGYANVPMECTPIGDAPFSATTEGALSIEPMTVQTVNLMTLIPGASGPGWAFGGGVLTILDGADVTVTTGGVDSDGRRIEITEDANATLALSDVVITNPVPGGRSPLNFLGNNVNLTLNLVGENHLTGSFAQPGIPVSSGSTITISGSGSLIATSGGGTAGIGVPGGLPGGTITITGNANVTAIGGYPNGAGIGGGLAEDSGTITITGNANVTAIGGYPGGAGIGGGGNSAPWVGSGGAGGTITIGGTATVTAIAASTGAAIGGGGALTGRPPGASGTIRIEDTATVHAHHGTHNGGAIGAGTNGGGQVGTITEPVYQSEDATVIMLSPVLHCDECDSRPCRCCPVSGEYPCECKDCEYCNGEGCEVCNPTPPQEITDTVLAVSTTHALQTQTATVQLRMHNNPGFAAMLMRLTFSEYLTLTGYTVGRPGLPDDALGGFRSPIQGNDDSFMGWLMRSEDITLNDLLLTLTFLVSSDAAPDAFLPVEITFESYEDGPELPSNAALEELEFGIINGGVRVREFRFGDANRDGRITSLDSTFLARYLVGGSGLTIDPFAMDLNADGYVDLHDLTLHAIWLVGLGRPPVLLET